MEEGKINQAVVHVKLGNIHCAVHCLQKTKISFQLLCLWVLDEVGSWEEVCMGVTFSFGISNQAVMQSYSYWGICTLFATE